MPKRLDLISITSWTRRQRERFLDTWWKVDKRGYRLYHKMFQGAGAPMILAIKHDPLFDRITIESGLWREAHP